MRELKGKSEVAPSEVPMEIQSAEFVGWTPAALTGPDALHMDLSLSVLAGTRKVVNYA